MLVVPGNIKEVGEYVARVRLHKRCDSGDSFHSEVRCSSEDTLQPKNWKEETPC